ncbi:LysR family transcriptional regulator [Pseudomonas sp. SO81]|uniref:LysR family transcriptional regulator n=1 Tax=Pseudomonas sp. SO81 TaxID=2983246 RepID=UPI0025A4C9A8|nr:LysR family transcriptional regulator [Pseudomonas sp. SO81]WJN58563.1 LysR family transcriptional regulator, regulator for bpeEF and oprC [Pseudomonas sp. SO81]
MDRLNAMLAFVRVAELASFTRAAESLGQPKASISLQVQQLENQLGARLLHRTTRRVQLTQDGQACYERCKDLLADADEIAAMFQLDAGRLRGRLRVDMGQALARDLVLPHLPAFLAEHPNLELELSCTDHKVDLIREGFDCVVRIGSLVDAALIARPLGLMEQINCASPDYLQRFGRPRSLADLAAHRLVHYVPTLGMKPIGWEFVEQGETRFLEMPGALTVNSTDAYTQACLAGLGIIQVPLAGIRGHLASGRLVEILPEYCAAPMPVSLLYPHRRNLSKRVQVFMDWLSRLVRDYLDGTDRPAAH